METYTYAQIRELKELVKTEKFVKVFSGNSVLLEKQATKTNIEKILKIFQDLNIATEDFLEEHNITFEEFVEQNKSNKRCINCINCTDCIGREECFDIRSYALTKNKKEAKKLLLKNPKINIATEDFLKEHNITFEEFKKQNETNKGCINCINCTNCTDCVECLNCKDCVECTLCIICNDCVNCNNCSESSKARHSSRCDDCSDIKYCENCKYSTSCKDCDGCFYCFNCIKCTDCEDCTDCSYCEKCKLCVDCADCNNCIDCVDCKLCDDCVKCTDCEDCDNCTNCGACINSKDCEGCENFSDKNLDMRTFILVENEDEIEKLLLDNPRINIATKDFLKENNTTFVEFEKQNETNDGCVNCLGCVECIACRECFGCFKCAHSTKCVDCSGLVGKKNTALVKMNIDKLPTTPKDEFSGCLNPSDTLDLGYEEPKRDNYILAKDIEEAKKLLQENPEINIATEDFLKEYNITFAEFKKQNETNKGCIDCLFCEDCVNCTSCKFCVNCDACVACHNCVDCFKCNICVNCADCTNCVGCIDYKSGVDVKNDNL